jgi:type II secretory pathway pseudopilin PulG
MPAHRVSRRPAAAGFTLIELMIAVLLLIVGLVAVAQLVPAAIESNFRNRYDSSGLIAAQRQLELMMAQEMDVGNPPQNGHYSFNVTLPDGTAWVVNMGLNTSSGACPPPGPSDAGAAAVTLPNGTWVIDWNQPQVAGYFNTFTSAERTAAESYLYESRWRVMTFYECISGFARPVGKRILLSTRGGPPGVAQPPTTLITLVGWER